MKKFIILSILIFNSIIILAIEVGGHITEDTTWTPDNNPYEVMDNIYVDEGVTLYIQPGCEIQISSALCTSSLDFDQNFWFQNGNNTAKMFWVNGRIVAEGTEQDSIVFTRMQDDFDYYWGCVYIPENGVDDLSSMSVFKHCHFEYSAGIGIVVGYVARGVLSIRTGYGYINNCTFYNNGKAISATNNLTQSIEVSSCDFYLDDNINNYVEGIWGYNYLSIHRPAINCKPALLADNNFLGNWISVSSLYFIDNKYTDCIELHNGYDDYTSYFYGNEFYNSDTGISCDDVSFLYIKNNQFIGGYDGIDISQAYVEISDNYFEVCGIAGPSAFELNGIVKNNLISDTNLAISGRYEEIYNNVFYNCNMVSSVIGSSNSFLNNLMINNNDLCNLLADTPIHENNIIINSNIDNIDIFGNPVFRNCIIDFPLEYPLIDGGGNIIVDSLQAQSIFEDIQNGDFHLADSSIAIDAGFDTLGYYYPFDLDYNHRVWDGDNNGTAIIDIGPYEYGAPALGGIEGITYNPITGDFVDYVLIKINNVPGEFTFSDSIGSYQYKLPAGFYDVYAERVFYDDAVEYQIEVFDGEFTQLDIPMNETVNVQNYEIIPTKNDFSLSNYPNPFNPSTTISFSIQNSSNIVLSIFNIKGQKVKTLFNENLPKGKHSTVWLGCDQNGNRVSSGIYFYKIKAGNQESVKRMLLLK